MGRYSTELYLHFESMTMPGAPTTTREALMEELCDIVLGEGGYRSLSEPGYRRLVTRQMLCLDPSLNWVELQNNYFFRKRFHEHGPMLLWDWQQQYAKDVLSDDIDEQIARNDLEQKIEEQDSELSGDLDY